MPNRLQQEKEELERKLHSLGEVIAEACCQGYCEEDLEKEYDELARKIEVYNEYLK